MKISTVKIRVASVVPGLGYTLLAKRKQALLSFVSVAIPLVLFFVLPWKYVKEFCLALAVFMWYFQYLSSVRVAKALASSENQSIYYDQEEIQYPPNFTKKERIAYAGREIVKRNLRPNEQLVEIVYAHQALVWYFIGLTQHSLIFVETDINSQPVGLQQFSHSDIKTVQLRSSLWVTYFSLAMVNGEKWDFQVPYTYKEGVKQIYNAVEKSENKTMNLIEPSRVESLKISVSKLDTGLLFVLPLIVGFSIFFGWTKLFPFYEGTTIDTFMMSLMLICFGISGLVLVVRKEAPGLRPRRGLGPIIMGTFMMLLWWGAAIYLWVRFLFKL